MAEWGVVRAPEKICTLGLGSCVGVVHCGTDHQNGRDGPYRSAGFAREQRGLSRAKFADTAMDDLLRAECFGWGRLKARS